MPGTPQPTLQRLPGDVIAAMDGRRGHRGRRALLHSSDGHYDIDLNAYLLLHPAPENTLAATAYDLAPAWARSAVIADPAIGVRNIS